MKKRFAYTKREMIAVLRQPMLWLSVCLCFTIGCQRDNADEVAALRKEVAQLRQEVKSLKDRMSVERRRVPEHERSAEHAGEIEKPRGVWQESSSGSVSTGGVRRVRSRMVRPTPEELKARHEAMRDPAKREQLRAEHRAHMEERKARLEERRQRAKERRQERQ